MSYGGEMSKWEEFDFEQKITEILSDDSEYAPGHQLGRPFLTAYQIAIEFARRHPDDFRRFGFPIGGVGIGQRNSLSQYLAQRLSALIGSGHIIHIEGGFLSNRHLNDITFKSEGETIRSSLTGGPYTLSMFRLRQQ
jgi:hypothetical protein